jgi:FtsP/CotA-like multicopper oxidase with cupredoxin domain
MPMEVPQVMDELVLGPAQRIDVIADIRAEPGGEALLASVERDQSFVVAAFPTGPHAAQAARPAPAALPPNTLPALDLNRAQRVALVMEGGAMRGLPSAVHKGQEMEMRALAEAGQFWAFNGQAGMSEAPLAELAVGETLRITIENRTAFAHAQHLHGHHFRGLQPDGRLGPWRDTILVVPGETREIAFTAEEPGHWMFHCHMLSHQMAGMMTWIRVT